MIKKLFVFIVLMTAAQMLHALTPEEITYITEDFPPGNYLEDGHLKGYSVEILKAIWKKMGVAEQPIKVLPWARGYKTLQQRPATMLFATVRTKEREPLFKWVGPIYSARLSLFSLSEKNFPVKKINDAKKYRVGVLLNDISEMALVNMKFPDAGLVRVSSLIQLIHMAKSDRLDFICTGEQHLKETLASYPDVKLKFKAVIGVADLSDYYAFNIKTDDALIKRYQDALNSINNERLEILQRYKKSNYEGR